MWKIAHCVNARRFAHDISKNQINEAEFVNIIMDLSCLFINLFIHKLSGYVCRLQKLNLTVNSLS